MEWRIYDGDSKDLKKPVLTEKDFLAQLALEMRCSGNFNRSTLSCHRQYSDDQDGFIDNVLGKCGSSKRACFENKARELYNHAINYFGSKDEVKYEHPYLKGARRIQSDAKLCR